MRVATGGATIFSFTSLGFDATPGIAMLTARETPRKELGEPETM